MQFLYYTFFIILFKLIHAMVICIVAGDTVVAAFQFDRQPPDLG